MLPEGIMVDYEMKLRRRRRRGASTLTTEVHHVLKFYKGLERGGDGEKYGEKYGDGDGSSDEDEYTCMDEDEGTCTYTDEDEDEGTFTDEDENEIWSTKARNLPCRR